MQDGISTRALLDRYGDLIRLEKMLATEWGIESESGPISMNDDGCLASYIPKLIREEIERIENEIAQRAGEE